MMGPQKRDGVMVGPESGTGGSFVSHSMESRGAQSRGADS